MKKQLFACLLGMAVILGGCEGTGPKQGAGTLIGAGLGALAGSQLGSGRGQLAAVAIGTLLGAAVGSELGAMMDEQDMALARRAEADARAAPVGRRVVWDNPRTGHSGSVTPIRDGRDPATGDFCREFQTVVNVGGRAEDAYGTACRRPDGSWEIVG